MRVADSTSHGCRPHPAPALPLTVLGTSSSLEEDARGSGSNSELGPALHLGILGQGWARIQL